MCIYRPINYNGAYTSDSNARFDQWLKSQNPLSGIKNFEDILFLATARGLNLLSDIAMPVRTIVCLFYKTADCINDHWQPTWALDIPQNQRRSFNEILSTVVDAPNRVVQL